MTSLPLDCTHGRTTSGVASHHRHRTSSHSWTTSSVTCHHRPWTANTIKRRRVWYAIISFGQHTRSNDVGRGMPSSPMGSTHDRTTSGMAGHHRLWVAQMVERHQAWHDITSLGQHTRSNNVGHGMPSLSLGSTHGRTTLGVACHQCL